MKPVVTSQVASGWSSSTAETQQRVPAARSEGTGWSKGLQPFVPSSQSELGLGNLLLDDGYSTSVQVLRALVAPTIQGETFLLEMGFPT